MPGGPCSDAEQPGKLWRIRPRAAITPPAGRLQHRGEQQPAADHQKDGKAGGNVVVKSEPSRIASHWNLPP